MNELQGQPTLSAIAIYPVKSCAPIACTEAVVEARGLVGDRRWMIVDAQGQFVTARKHPRLLRVRTHLDAQGVRLEAEGRARLHLRADAGAPRLPVTVWSSTVDAQVATPEVDAWMSDFLGFPVRLVHMDEACLRPVSEKYGQPGDIVSFADGYPLLLTSAAAVDALNARLARPVTMQRFRPSIVVSGVAAHAEDGWKSIRIGAVRFDVVKPCVRCVLTTVDPERGEVDADGEPLRTLIGYRRSAAGVTFGQNLIPRDHGRIRVGDAVELLA